MFNKTTRMKKRVRAGPVLKLAMFGEWFLICFGRHSVVLNANYANNSWDLTSLQNLPGPLILSIVSMLRNQPPRPSQC
jgi:hypothetical protein